MFTFSIPPPCRRWTPCLSQRMNPYVTIADLLSWTVAAPLVRAWRQRQIARQTHVQRTVRRVDDLLQTMVRAHPDVAW